MTPFKTKCAILAEIWMDYRDDVNFDDLFKYGDLAFPLAYLIDNKYVKATDKAKAFVVEIFELLLDSLGIEEDTGFEDVDDIFLSTDGEWLDSFEEEEEEEEEDEQNAK